MSLKIEVFIAVHKEQIDKAIAIAEEQYAIANSGGSYSFDRYWDTIRPLSLEYSMLIGESVNYILSEYIHERYLMAKGIGFKYEI